jgi:hypothetical protein
MKGGVPNPSLKPEEIRTKGMVILKIRMNEVVFSFQNEEIAVRIN